MQAAADLAGRAAAANADSLALMRHRSVTEALQPPRPAVVRVARGLLEIAGRFRNCSPEGTWFEHVRNRVGNRVE